MSKVSCGHSRTFQHLATSPCSHATILSYLNVSWNIACVHAKLTQSCPTLCECSPPGSSVHEDSPGSGLPCPPPGNLSNPGIEPIPLVSPAFQAGSLSTVPPRKHFQNIELDKIFIRDFPWEIMKTTNELFGQPNVSQSLFLDSYL